MNTGLPPTLRKARTGGIDAAGDDLLGAAEEFFGFGVNHAVAFHAGTMRLKPRLMPMS